MSDVGQLTAPRRADIAATASHCQIGALGERTQSLAVIRVLEAQPLGYRVVRQKGSHRKLEASNHPAITFSFHDNQTSRPGTVKDILCNQVGLAEQDALALL